MFGVRTQIADPIDGPLKMLQSMVLEVLRPLVVDHNSVCAQRRNVSTGGGREDARCQRKGNNCLYLSFSMASS